MPLRATGSEPVGYWNALGLLAALGALLAFGLATRRATRRPDRGGGVNRSPGAHLLLHVQSRRLDCIGDRHRRRSSPRSTPASARSDDGDRRPWPALAVLLASSSGPRLTEEGGHTLAAAEDGAHRRRCGRRPRTRRRRSSDSRRGVRVAGSSVRLFAGSEMSRLSARCSPAAAGVLGLGGRCDCEVVRRRHGGRRGRLERTPLQPVRQRPRRTVAVALDDASRILVGSGAGSFKRYWLEHRPGAWSIRDAHTLYIEMLAELGPVGLVLILAAFGYHSSWPCARRRPLVPIAAAARRLPRARGHRLGLGSFRFSPSSRSRAERDRRRGERRKRSDSPASDSSPSRPSSPACHSSRSRRSETEQRQPLRLPSARTTSNVRKKPREPSDSRRGRWSRSCSWDEHRRRLVSAAARGTFERVIAREPDHWRAWFELLRSRRRRTRSGLATGASAEPARMAHRTWMKVRDSTGQRFVPTELGQVGCLCRAVRVQGDGSSILGTSTSGRWE